MELTLKVSDTQIKCENVVKLLRVDLEYQLNFAQHISNLCRKAGQQLNVLKRLSPFLSRLDKLTIFHTFIYLILIIDLLLGVFVLMLEKIKSVH